MLFVRRWIAPRVLVGLISVFSVTPKVSFAVDIVKFEVDFFEDGKEEPINHATIWTTGRKIRVDQMKPGGGQNGSSLVYRGDQDLVMSVSDRTQSYVKVERRLLEQMDGRVRAGRRSVEEHLKALPNDQRKGLETLLGVSREDPNATINPIVVESVKDAGNRAGEVAGFACERKVMRRGSVVIGEACVAPWERIGMTLADMEVFRSLANYQRDALGVRQITPLEIVPDQPLDMIVQLGGIPLSFERMIGAKRRSAVRVSSVDWVSEAGTLFDAPANYTQAAGYEAMLAHLMPSNDSPEQIAERLAEKASSTKAASPVAALAPAGASTAVREGVPASGQAVSLVSTDVPAAPAFSQSFDASVDASMQRPRTIMLRSKPNARRTVGATPNRTAPVRLFPNR